MATKRRTTAPTLEDTLREADALRDAKRADEALKLLQAAAKRFPDRWEPRLEIAKIAMAQWSDKSAIHKRLTPALRLLTAHLKKAPNDARAHYEMAAARYHIATYPRFNGAQAGTALRALELALPVAGAQHPDLYDKRAQLLLDALNFGSTNVEERLETLRSAVAALAAAKSPGLRARHATLAEQLRKDEASRGVDAELEKIRELEDGEDYKGALKAIDRLLATSRARLGHQLDDVLYTRATILDERGLGTRKQAHAAWTEALHAHDTPFGKSQPRGRLGLFALEDYERTKKRASLDEARALLELHEKDSVYPDTDLLFALAKAHAYAGAIDDALRALQKVFKRRRESAPFRARARREGPFKELVKTHAKLAKALAR